MKTLHTTESRFQSFDDPASRDEVAGRLAALRDALGRDGLDGFLVPRADAFQGEYVPASEERLAWLTGFTGSAGFAIVLREEAALFVDGRYTIQVREQTDLAAFTPVDLVGTPPASWLREHAKAGTRIGYDAWLLTPGQVDTFERAARDAGADLQPVAANPIDALWTDRPAPPSRPMVLYPARLAGADAATKLARVADALGPADALVMSDPHSVAWAFNIRGSDVAHTPIARVRALLRKHGRPTIYIADAALTDSVRDELAALADLRDPDGLVSDLATLGQDKQRVRFDAATVPAAVVRPFQDAGGTADVGGDPVSLMRAVKSKAEQRGARAAHARDAIAVCRFLHWFEHATARDDVTEVAAACALEAFRTDTRRLKDISFPTISAFGAHAASPHYRVTHASDVPIGRGLYLVDSGAQYEDGTTDITRTVAVGRPSREMRDRFTRVLKGHIAIARAVFPAGTSGAQIDALARTALWEAGLDFDHGTGHGVGAYLSVHEGPQRISKLGTVPLQPGMILSNEPGYYKAGAWGIRTENLLLVEERRIEGAERQILGFETLTLVPISRDLIDPKLLRSDEIAWLDAYHARVRSTVGPKLDPAGRRWLAAATRRLLV